MGSLFDIVRFNCYLTIPQKQLLDKYALSNNRLKTDIIREALHYYFRERGIDDGLIYDTEDFMRHYDKQRAEQ